MSVFVSPSLLATARCLARPAADAQGPLPLMAGAWVLSGAAARVVLVVTAAAMSMRRMLRSVVVEDRDGGARRLAHRPLGLRIDGDVDGEGLRALLVPVLHARELKEPAVHERRNVQHVAVDERVVDRHHEVA